MDKTDEKILELLKGNARMSYSKLGEALGMSRVAAKKRVMKLEREGIIRGCKSQVAAGSSYGAKHKPSSSSTSSGRSVDDLDLEGLCEDYRDEFDDIDDTWDYLEDNYPYSIHTLPAVEVNPELYSETENRVSIFSRYRVLRQMPVFDAYSAVCTELDTDMGRLVVYGTIIGIYGNRNKSFKPDLLSQMSDIHALSIQGHSICMVGDYNCSFSDNYYYTIEGRTLLLKSFDENQMNLVTASQSQCIDHIALSKAFIGDSRISVKEWNEDKCLSDHKGIAIEMTQR